MVVMETKLRECDITKSYSKIEQQRPIVGIIIQLATSSRYYIIAKIVVEKCYCLKKISHRIVHMP